MSDAEDEYEVSFQTINKEEEVSVSGNVTKKTDGGGSKITGKVSSNEKATVTIRGKGWRGKTFKEEEDGGKPRAKNCQAHEIPISVLLTKRQVQHGRVEKKSVQKPVKGKTGLLSRKKSG